MTRPVALSVYSLIPCFAISSARKADFSRFVAFRGVAGSAVGCEVAAGVVEAVAVDVVNRVGWRDDAALSASSAKRLPPEGIRPELSPGWVTGSVAPLGLVSFGSLIIADPFGLPWPVDWRQVGH